MDLSGPGLVFANFTLYLKFIDDFTISPNTMYRPGISKSAVQSYYKLLQRGIEDNL